MTLSYISQHWIRSIKLVQPWITHLEITFCSLLGSLQYLTKYMINNRDKRNKINILHLILFVV